MKYPNTNTSNSTRQVISRFPGLTRREIGTEGAFSDCKNMSSDEYPAVCTRRGYEVNTPEGLSGFQAILPGYCEGFCGVANGKAYWDGSVVEYESENNAHYTISPTSKIKMYWQNTKVYIYEKRENGISVLYNFNTMETIGLLAQRRPYIRLRVVNQFTYREMADDAIKIETDANWTYIGSRDETQGREIHALASAEKLIIYGKVGEFEDNRNRYMTYQETRYGPIGEEAYEFECSEDGSLVTTPLWGLKGKFKRRDSASHLPSCGAISSENRETVGGLYQKIVPQMAQPCVYKNRLWGGTADGSTIIASKYDDFTDFYDFSGDSGDSIYIEISSPGEFAGMISYNECVIAFKRDSMVVIYGDTADNFQIGKEIKNIGTIDIRSCRIIDGVLFFAGRDGIYAYSGGYPQFISSGLDAVYTEAISFTHMGKYYIEGTKETGEKEMLVYDTRSGVWMAEDVLNVRYAEESDGTYVVTSSGIYKMKETGRKNTEWSFTTCGMFESFGKSAATEISIKCRLSGFMKLHTVSEEGEEEHGTFYGHGEIYTYRVPVRLKMAESYKIKLSGNGKCIIYAIERVTAPGGRNIREEYHV